MNRLEYYNEFINKNLNEDIFVDDPILRVSIINQEKGSFSEFFTFRNKGELLLFLKEVVIVSAALSSFYSQKGVSLYLREHSEVLDIIDRHTDYFNKKIGIAYLNSYEKIENLYARELITDSDISILVREIEKEFDAYNEVYISLDYASSTDIYLKNILDENSKGLGIDIFNRELKAVDLSVEMIKYVIENIFECENNIRENILDKIPY